MKENKNINRKDTHRKNKKKNTDEKQSLNLHFQNYMTILLNHDDLN